jgi:hypothetical protein
MEPNIHVSKQDWIQLRSSYAFLPCLLLFWGFRPVPAIAIDQQNLISLVAISKILRRVGTNSTLPVEVVVSVCLFFFLSGTLFISGAATSSAQIASNMIVSGTMVIMVTILLIRIIIHGKSFYVQ